MKNQTKNIILILVIVLSLLGLTLTIYHAKENIKEESMINERMGEAPPEIEKKQNTEDNQNNNEQIKPDEGSQNMPKMSEDNQKIDFPNNQNNKLKLTTPYVIIITIFALTLSLSLLYLIMNIQNKAFYKNKDKLTIYIMSTVILTFIICMSLIVLTNNYILNSSNKTNTTKENVVLDKNNIVSDEVVDLRSQKTDVTITSGGIYTITGTFTNSIIIDAENEEVNLILDNVTITNKKTAAIIGLNASKINITLKDGTTNTLSDGGSSEYDGCIYSNAMLEFDGIGTLIVSGNQEEGEGIATETNDITINSGTYYITSNDDGLNAGGDGGTITINGGTLYINASGDGIDSNKNAIINGGTIFVIGSDVGGDSGIDTDEGYVINGGTVVALGTDMIELPDDTSLQNALAVTLDEKISKNSLVSLVSDDSNIISFIAPKSFKTIIISTSNLNNGSYSLYKEEIEEENINYGITNSMTRENIISVNNITTFEISKTINHYTSR